LARWPADYEVCHYAVYSVSSSSSSPDTLLSTQFSNNLYSSLIVRDLAACPYNTAGKIIPSDKVLLNKQGYNINQCCMISILTFLNNKLK
jgi:hypothetical protein